MFYSHIQPNHGVEAAAALREIIRPRNSARTLSEIRKHTDPHADGPHQPTRHGPHPDRPSGRCVQVVTKA
jgi:hypothetical protein